MRSLKLLSLWLSAIIIFGVIGCMPQKDSSPLIKITKTKILLGNKTFTESDFGNTDSFIISSLSEELAKSKSEQITIDAEKDVPFIMLLKVIITAGRNNCSKIKLMSGNEVFGIQLPELMKDESNKPFSLKVIITNSKITIVDNEKLFDTQQNIAKLASGEYDLKTFETILDQAYNKMKENGLWDRHLTVFVAENEIPYETLFHVLGLVSLVESGKKPEKEEWHKVSFGRLSQ